jgi:hypothetical protein
MKLNRYQIADSENSVGRIFRKGSFWDKLFKGATAIATVFVPIIGAGMAALDKYTPERSGSPGGGDSRPGGGRSGGGRSGGGRSPFDYDASNVAGIGNYKQKNELNNTPKVF